MDKEYVKKELTAYPFKGKLVFAISFNLCYFDISRYEVCKVK